MQPCEGLRADEIAADRVAGCLLGLIVGDALGLPREGLSPQRAERLFGGAPLRHHFLGGRGMMSDDGEHACMTAQALLASGGDPTRFARSLAWKLRWWLLGLPAGAGKATLTACLRLWCGCAPAKSGVPSAGNGAAMRAPIIGAFAHAGAAELAALVRVSTRMTHTDPRAEAGTLALALAARQAILHGPVHDAGAFLAALRPQIADAELAQRLDLVAEHLARGATPEAYVAALGLTRGVTGYINNTVPVALYCWLRHPEDFAQAVEAAILLGGDADTTGAVVGALAGAALGVAALPPAWLRLAEWPRSTGWVCQVAAQLAAQARGEAGARPVPLAWPGLLPRNLLFLLVVLVHAVRRMWP